MTLFLAPYVILVTHSSFRFPVSRASQNKHECFSLRFRPDGLRRQKPFNLSFDQMNLFSFITVNDNRFLPTCLIVHGNKKCHRVTRGLPIIMLYFRFAK